MLKKAAIGLGLLTVGAYLWLGTSVPHFVSVGYDRATGWVSSQVPLETKLDVLQKQISEMDAKIRETKIAMLKEERKLQDHETQYAKQQDKVDRQNRLLASASTELKNPTVAADSARKAELHATLKQRLREAESENATLQTLSMTGKALVQSYNAKVKQVKETVALRTQAQAQLDQLRAKLDMVKAQEAAQMNPTPEDDNGDMKRLLKEVSDQIYIRERLLDEDITAPKEAVDPGKLQDDVDQYLKKNGIETQPSGTKL